MDEGALRIYGLSNCRVRLILSVLRKKLYILLQGLLSALYFIFVVGVLICHDIWFSEFSEQTATTVSPVVASNGDDVERGLWALLIIEASLLLMFVLDIVINSIGYGCLYF